MRTFGELKFDIGERINDTGMERLSKIGKAVNLVYMDVWNSYLWKETILFDVRVEVASGQDLLTIPTEIGEILAVTEKSGGRLLVPTSSYVFQGGFLNEALTRGGLCAYTKAGSSGVWSQPAFATTLRAASSDANDVLRLRIRGKTSAGMDAEEVLVLNGTQEVSGGVVFGSLTGWSKAADSKGSITLCAADGTMLDRLETRRRSNRYIVIKLAQAATQPMTFYVTGKRSYIPLIEDEDTPLLPVTGALFALGLAEALRQAGKYAQAQVEESRGWAALERILSAGDILSEAQEQTIPVLGIERLDEEI